MGIQPDAIVEHVRRHLSRFDRAADQIRPDTSMIEWFDRRRYTEEDISGFFYWANELCGAKVSAEELELLFGHTEEVALEPDRRVTFRDLAVLIQSQLAKVSFDPISVAGSTCTKAGAFVGIKSIAERVGPGNCHLGPSTTIESLLSGEGLLAFWSQVELYSQTELPRIQRWSEVNWLVYAAALLFVGIPALLGVVAAELNMPLEVLFPWVLLPLTSLLVTIAFRIEDSPCGPVPRPFRTFRDLAEFVSSVGCRN